MAVAPVRCAVDAAAARAWLAAIDTHPAWRRDAPSGADFNPYSSSLRAVAVESLALEAIARELLAGAVGGIARARLGDAVSLDVDQCWIRRQYAPSRAPAGHAPHSWHQDGALGFDFLSSAPGEGALLAMLTCWIALTPCGVDAPAIEFAGDDRDALLPLAALTDAAVRAGHSEGELRRPALAPGDALVFGGGVLHHTHVAPGMTGDRTSLELRFFPAGEPPARLRGDRFLTLHLPGRPAA